MSIYLDHNNLNGPNLTELRNLLWGNNKIKTISVCGCNIGNEGAVSIAEGYVRNSSVTHLYLRDNHISDLAGVELIKGLLVERKVPIEVLDISYNMLKEKSGEILVHALPRMKNPPSKICLAYNLLETHKYKILHLFTMK